MSTMGMIVGIVLYMVLSLVFIVSFTSICYQLSPYSRLRANAILPEWERKTLYTLAGYPPVSLLLLVILAFVLPEWAAGKIPEYKIIFWFCVGHVLLSVAGVVCARYLRKRNNKNNFYYFTDIATGCIYAGILIAIVFLVQ